MKKQVQGNRKEKSKVNWNSNLNSTFSRIPNLGRSDNQPNNKKN